MSLDFAALAAERATHGCLRVRAFTIGEAASREERPLTLRRS